MFPSTQFGKHSTGSTLQGTVMHFEKWLHNMLFLKQSNLRSFPSLPSTVRWGGHASSSATLPANQNGWFFSVPNPTYPLSAFQMGFFRRRYKEIIEAEKNRKENEDGWDWVQKNQWPATPVTWPTHFTCRPWSLYLPYLEERIFSRFFGGPTDAVLILILSSPGANLRQPLWPGHMTGATTTSFEGWTLNFGKQATEPSNIYGCNMRGQPSGENCYLKVFL